MTDEPKFGRREPQMPETFGEQLRWERERAKLTMGDLVRRLAPTRFNLSLEGLSQLERETGGTVSLQNVADLARVLAADGARERPREIERRLLLALGKVDEKALLIEMATAAGHRLGGFGGRADGAAFVATCKRCGEDYPALSSYLRQWSADGGIPRCQGREAAVPPAPEVRVTWLTAEELRVMDLLIEASRAFGALPEHHPSELAEWIADLHHLQERLMARAAIRAYPERFTAMVQRPAAAAVRCPTCGTYGCEPMAPRTAECWPNAR